VTALVNNAGGTFGVRAIADTDAALVEQTLAVNLARLICFCRETVRRMSTVRNGGGG